MSLDTGLTHSHERVEGELLVYGRRDCWLSLAGLCLGPRQLLCHCRAVWFHRRSKLEVLDSVFMAAVHVGRWRQSTKDLHQRSVHVGCWAFKETATASDEQRVTSKHDSRFTSWLNKNTQPQWDHTQWQWDHTQRQTVTQTFMATQPLEVNEEQFRMAVKKHMTTINLQKWLRISIHDMTNINCYKCHCLYNY